MNCSGRLVSRCGRLRSLPVAPELEGVRRTSFCISTGFLAYRMACPLCYSARVRLYAEVQGRRYLGCSTCRLTFLDPVQRLSAPAEQAHYGTHENDPMDPSYRRFLSQLSGPLVARLPTGTEGLDYGSGPGPTLSLMLEEQGYRVQIFDPFFSADASVLARTYDFITATEVVEHFFSPREEFDQMNRMLRPGGWLAIMTETLREERAFSTWRYARDPTHVCFFHPATLRWIAEHYGWSMESPQQNVILFHKPAVNPSRA